jgi:hypothetical protein
MSNVSDVIHNIAEAAETTSPYASVVYGSDPPENGICMIWGAGFQSETHLNRGMMCELPVLLNGKNKSQEAVLDALSAIHELLTKDTDYNEISTDEIQVVAIETTSSPSIIGREQNSQWLCGSSFAVYYYWR